MKTIIAGSRDITDYRIVVAAITDSDFTITEVVSGGARGVDTLGENWARTNNTPVKVFPADWDKFGKSAGYRRNEDMANYADALIAIRLNNSRGTTHMIDIATKRGLKVYTMDI